MSKPKPTPAPPRMSDVFLREMGFRIWSRPHDSQPQWERQGRVYPQDQAYRMAVSERQKMLKQLESL